jgi:hypothetical protein
MNDEGLCSCALWGVEATGRVGAGWRVSSLVEPVEPLEPLALVEPAVLIEDSEESDDTEDTDSSGT